MTTDTDKAIDRINSKARSTSRAAGASVTWPETTKSTMDLYLHQITHRLYQVGHSRPRDDRGIGLVFEIDTKESGRSSTTTACSRSPIRRWTCWKKRHRLRRNAQTMHS